MVIAISLREGNFATGSLIPDKNLPVKLAQPLGFSVEHADGRNAASLPVPAVAGNSVKIAGYAISARGASPPAPTLSHECFPCKATLLKGC